MNAGINCCEICANEYKWKFDDKNRGPKMEILENGKKVAASINSGNQTILGTKSFANGIHQYKVMGLNLDAPCEEFGIIPLEDFHKAKLKDSNRPDTSIMIIGVNARSSLAKMKGIFKYENKQWYLVTVDRIKQKLTINGPNSNAYADLDPKIIYYPCFCTDQNSEYCIDPLF